MALPAGGAVTEEDIKFDLLFKLLTIYGLKIIISFYLLFKDAC